MAYGPFNHVAPSGWMLCLSVSSNPPTRGALWLQYLTVSLLLDASCVVGEGDCWVFPTGEEKYALCCFQAVFCCCMASVFLPTPCSLNNACRSRLAAAFCLLLYITVYWYNFWLLIFFFLFFYFVLCSLLFLSTLPLLSYLSPVLFFFYLTLSTPLCLPGTQRERWPWSCVFEA